MQDYLDEDELALLNKQRQAATEIINKARVRPRSDVHPDETKSFDWAPTQEEEERPEGSTPTGTEDEGYGNDYDWRADVVGGGAGASRVRSRESFADIEEEIMRGAVGGHGQQKKQTEGAHSFVEMGQEKSDEIERQILKDTVEGLGPLILTEREKEKEKECESF